MRTHDEQLVLAGIEEHCCRWQEHQRLAAEHQAEVVRLTALLRSGREAPPPPPSWRLHTIPQAADELRVSESTVWRLIRSGVSVSELVERFGVSRTVVYMAVG